MRSPRKARASFWLAFSLLLITLFWSLPEVEAEPAAGTAAAATEHPLSTREARLQLQRGGNAIDAAVTAALVAGVVSPSSSGLGGGGFALVWQQEERRAYAFDFREVAPRALDSKRFFERPFASNERGQLVGVPGEVMGLFELHRRFGKRTWAEVVEPAQRWAERGFPVGRHLSNVLAQGASTLTLDPEIAALYYPQGRPPLLGNTLKNPRLAETLERIGNEGPQAFYAGSIAADLVATARAQGSTLTLEDLAAYRVVERPALAFDWEGHRIYTMPPPSAGGLLLAQVLGSFSAAELRGLGVESGAYQHLTAEVMRSSLVDRLRYIGDPDHVPVDMAKLLSAERIRANKAAISPKHTRRLPELLAREHGTHHLSVADASGNVVSLTTTINRGFGAKLMAPNSGVLLNDELDDFADSALLKSLPEAPNRARPSARPVSSMTPTIVTREGRPVLALGGSGGMAIAPNVTQVLLRRLAFRQSTSYSVAAPRFGLALEGGNTILLEQAAPARLRRELEARGESVGTLAATTAAVQLIARERSGFRPASDPRKFGSAAAW